MAKYKIANCIVEYCPLYDLLKKQLEPYKYIGEEKYDFCLELNETFYQTKLLENPHLTLAQCEYIFAGSYFYRYLLKYHGFMPVSYTHLDVYKRQRTCTKLVDGT